MKGTDWERGVRITGFIEIRTDSGQRIQSDNIDLGDRGALQSMRALVMHLRRATMITRISLIDTRTGEVIASAPSFAARARMIALEYSLPPPLEIADAG